MSEICQKAFNETLRTIIIWVIDQVKSSTPDNQILTALGIKIDE